MNVIVQKIRDQIDASKKNGTYKVMPELTGPSGPTVHLTDGREVVNLCSNNYLGLANHPDVVAKAKEALECYGNGTASVRFICGTFSIHAQLENAIAQFLGMERATTYASCWNANEALVPTLLRDGGAVISDELNHASIVDACRLCGKNAQRLIYQHSDMQDLKRCLEKAKDSPRILIITDGVFSMEGDLAKLDSIVELAKTFNALVAVDDSHAHGVVGQTGRGTPEYFGVPVDIITGTLGKTLGGATGGFIAGPEAVIELMEQYSRPQLFSNALSPATAGGALAAIDLLKQEPERVSHLQKNVAYLREGLRKLDYEVIESVTAILPIMVGETAKAIHLSRKMLEHGLLITGFSFPVVPEGTARLRAQVCSLHTRNHLDKVLALFESVRDII
jgi:glycine C-acetyltransferase